MYQAGSASPPTRTPPWDFTGITGSARGAGPCTRSAPTYRASFFGFMLTTKSIGSYWEPWQMQYTGFSPNTAYVGGETTYPRFGGGVLLTSQPGQHHKGTQRSKSTT